METKNRFKQIVSVVLCIFLLSGCSVQMAARGRSVPEMDLIKVELDRRYVIGLIGEPDMVESTLSGPEEIYYLHTEHKGWRYSRATLYAFLDVGTLCLWELLGTPLEDFIQSKNSLTIRYDENNLIKSFAKESN